MTIWILLSFSGLLIIGLGLWSRSRGSPFWRNRLFSGTIIFLVSIYYILSN
ncbi:MAG: hypothetical protein JNM55_08570 [Anaerolineales bacterium]|nr:hypothetical protein [Anaerolineales bacterium]